MDNKKIYFAKVDVASEAKIPTKRDEDMAYDVYAYFNEDKMVIQH